MAMRAAPDPVGALDGFGVGGLVKGPQVLVCMANGANAPSVGRSPFGISLGETLSVQRGAARPRPGSRLDGCGFLAFASEFVREHQ